MSETQYVTHTGPPHPDFFDGETPLKSRISVPKNACHYRIGIAWIEPQPDTIDVIAISEDDAIERAIKRAESMRGDVDFEVDFVDRLPDQPLTESDLRAAGLIDDLPT